MAPMNKMSRYPSECKVYVGDLGNLATKQELEDTFSYYGSLRNVWVARNPPGFAFVEFEDARDAKDAIRGLNGRTICGRRARVEPSNGRRLGNRAIFRRGGGRLFQSEDRCYECGERGHYARNCQERDWKRGSKRASRPRYGSRSRYRSRSRSRNGSRDGSSSRSRMSTSSTSGYPPVDGRRNRSTSGSRKSSSRSRSPSSNRSRRSDRTKKRSKRESSDWSDSSPCGRNSKSRSTIS